MWLSILGAFLLLVCVACAWLGRRATPPRLLPVSERFTGDNAPSEYDFIVVGSGSAGCVLASRLAEAVEVDGTPKFSVLLLEAGAEAHKSDVASTPIEWLGALMTSADWHYAYEANPKSGGRYMHHMRGKTTGGCSAINAQMWVRGAKEDYDGWAAQGNEGWAWKDVLPCFKSIESFPEGDPAVRGHNGPVKVRFTPSVGSNNFVEAAVNAGIPKAKDHNGENRHGISINQQNNLPNARHDAFSAFIDPIAEQPNLTVISSAMVHDITFDDNTATHVNVKVNGSLRAFSAKKEIILSAGAFNSPQILMLSGVGPRAHLEELGIPVVKDSPVGQNLHDHVGIGLPFLIDEDQGANGDCSGLNACGFVQTEWAKKNTPASGEDLQIVGLHGKIILDQFSLAKSHGLLCYADPGTWKYNVVARLQRNLKRLAGSVGFLKDKIYKTYCINTGLQQPTSRGQLKLRSRDPYERLLIDPNMLDTEDDIERLMEGVELMRKIMKQEPFASLGCVEAPEFIKFQSEEDIRQFIRDKCNHWWHPVGTAKMAPGSDGVVDNRLRVKGMRRLRVADASIMPTICSGNTNWPSMMIGARAAELILEDHE